VGHLGGDWGKTVRSKGCTPLFGTAGQPRLVGEHRPNRIGVIQAQNTNYFSSDAKC